MQQAVFGRPQALPSRQATGRIGRGRHVVVVRAAKQGSGSSNGAAPPARKRPEYVPNRCAAVRG